MALVSIEGLKSGEDYNNLLKLCRIVFARHYNMYTQFKDELIGNAVVDVYGALEKYNDEFSIINYLYTVIRNSYTKDINKLKRTFVREDTEFRNCIAEVEIPKMVFTSAIIDEVSERLELNKHHKYYLIKSILNSGIHIDKKYTYSFNPGILDEDDSEYLSRVVAIVIYEHKLRGLI